MSRNPILFVEDDLDDRELIRDVVTELAPDRPVLYLESGAELVAHLQEAEEAPFLIVCDVNLAGEDGFALRKRIANDPELKYKSVPFIFWSSGASEAQIQYAYDLPAQGFFFKPLTMDELRDTVRTIFDYWHKGQHPKKVS